MPRSGVRRWSRISIPLCDRCSPPAVARWIRRCWNCSRMCIIIGDLYEASAQAKHRSRSSPEKRGKRLGSIRCWKRPDAVRELGEPKSESKAACKGSSVGRLRLAQENCYLLFVGHETCHQGDHFVMGRLIADAVEDRPSPQSSLRRWSLPQFVPVELVADLAPLVIVMVVFLRRVEGRGRHDLRGDRLLEASRLLQSALGGFGQPLL